MNATQQEHWPRLHALIREFGPDPDKITPDAKLIDLGFDSLDNVELVMAIEQAWGVDILEEDADTWENGKGTIQTILDYLEANAD